MALTKTMLDIQRACPRKKEATLIFAITSPPVEIFLQFLKRFVQE